MARSDYERVFCSILVVLSVLLLPHLSLVVAMEETNSSQGFWLYRPGTVYACEGHPVTFQWQYNSTVGSFKVMAFNKIRPARQFIAWMDNTGKVDLPLARVKLVSGSMSGVIINDAQANDEGVYRMQIFVDIADVPTSFDDVATLKIKATSECPESQSFKQPRMSLESHQDIDKEGMTLSGNIMEFDTAGPATLVVALPAADPPVTCTVTLGETSHSCLGRKDRETECKAELDLGSVDYQTLTVTLSFIAFEDSITEVSVIRRGYTPGFVTNDLYITANHISSHPLGENDTRPSKKNPLLGVMAGVVVLLAVSIAVTAVVMITLHRTKKKMYRLQAVRFRQAPEREACIEGDTGVGANQDSQNGYEAVDGCQAAKTQPALTPEPHYTEIRLPGLSLTSGEYFKMPSPPLPTGDAGVDLEFSYDDTINKQAPNNTDED